ncbi:flagella basal body P-ring formation protein FlgA [Aquibium oceanicum]|uniref:Flagella basal body P-ring formation protein FlgA n=2 Tax=Aquibium oceanicum TaxID=1670800 RepID=A0A1L3SW19_9HYPH|nr:flagella basal body P-ring formation protein FlgA [Aquibium oceanicum]
MPNPLMALLRSALAAFVLSTVAGHAAAQEMAVIPKRVIYPGETIEVAALSEVPLRRSSRITTSIAMYVDQIDGMVAKRTLLPGKLIPLSSVREAYLVEAGAPVRVNYVEGSLQISTVGVPLQPGAAGDVVRVRNSESGAVLTGTVMVDGTIRVGGL